MNTETLYQRAEAHAAQVGDQVLLLNVEFGAYHALNDVGSRIWECLERPITREALLEKLLGEYDVEAGACRKEMDAFLEDLRARHLLKEQGPTGEGAGPAAAPSQK